MNKGKFYSIMLLAVATSILFAPNYASAAESNTLKANISHTEKSLTVEFSEAPTIKGKNLQEASTDTVQFLKDFFVFEHPATNDDLSEGDEAALISQFDSKKVLLTTTENSVTINLQDNLTKTIAKGFLRVNFHIDLNNIKDAKGNTLSAKSTGATNNLKTRSTRRISINIRAKYNKDFELNSADTETYIFVPGTSANWKNIRDAISNEMKAEADAAKQAKAAKESGDAEKIKASNENVAKLTRKSSVEALTVEVPAPQPPVDPADPKQPMDPKNPTDPKQPMDPKGSEEPAQPVEPAKPVAPIKPEMKKRVAIKAPNTGVQKADNSAIVLAVAVIALTSATYITVKKF